MTTAELRPPAGGPAWLVIQLLERCNLRCNMCYEWGESGAYKALPGLAELDLDVSRGARPPPERVRPGQQCQRQDSGQ